MHATIMEQRPIFYFQCTFSGEDYVLNLLISQSRNQFALAVCDVQRHSEIDETLHST